MGWNRSGNHCAPTERGCAVWHLVNNVRTQITRSREQEIITTGALRHTSHWSRLYWITNITNRAKQCRHTVYGTLEDGFSFRGINAFLKCYPEIARPPLYLSIAAHVYTIEKTNFPPIDWMECLEKTGDSFQMTITDAFSEFNQVWNDTKSTILEAHFVPLWYSMFIMLLSQ